MDKKTYRLSCLCETQDGTTRSFELSIDPPFAPSADELACTVVCPEIKPGEIVIYGATAEQAYALAHCFVASFLEYGGARFVDDAGETVVLPRYPEQER